MLISFSVENWMSFRDRVSFSMIASRERQHGERVSRVNKYPIRILPVAAIYGGNASGKTCFFKAINFAKDLIVRGIQPDSLIPVETFRLDSFTSERPSRFEFELLINDTVYEYCFTVTRKKVLEEKLTKINSTSESVLFNRTVDSMKFSNSMADDRTLFFVNEGTRENQLFLTNSVSQNVDTFRPIYDWFKKNLVLIAPDSRFEPFEQFLDESNPLYAIMNNLLPELDTGIIRLAGEDVSFESLPFPESMKVNLQKDLQEGIAVRIVSSMNERYIVQRKNGNLIAKRLVAYHRKSDGTEVRFEIYQESDGSQRLIDLLPAFLDLASQSSERIYLIDELDRSLHSQLTTRLLEVYLANCNQESRMQLVVTTHDLLLMDQQLFRRDEMWVTERDPSGVSSLISFGEYKDVRYDKDIRKSYLQGRMRGVPHLSTNQFVSLKSVKNG
ncbi:MAG: ATP-binding protein [Candidatus Sabulitectum sp.]|nr:ATP-binding protein [Candidatus Sabulitectum sp.]